MDKFNGILNVYKEAGFTSHDVVAKLRGILKQKKIGHTGTLDPGAVGVLPICLGKATKLSMVLTDKDKEYVAVLRLGITTDTQDMTGTVLGENPVTVSEEKVREVILSFLGSYPQIPPMYSAIKINGKKLYELARVGKEVERPPRMVDIKELEILRINLPEVEFRVVCSKGTYVRTLCHDIGEKLGCGGTMSALERTRSGEFTVADALTLSQIEELIREGKIEDKIFPSLEGCPQGGVVNRPLPPPPTPTAIAIGKFDGIHLGHQKLLTTLLKQKQNGLKTIVVTFDPPPEVFFLKAENKQLLTKDEKEEFLKEIGVDSIFYYTMNEANAAMSAESFIEEILLKKLNMAYICAGQDLRFGAGGSGNSDLLLEIAKKRGFEAQIINKIYFEGNEISSTFVREAVESGNLTLTYDLLGRSYSFSGKVSEGMKLGRTLGFPTANLAITDTKILPPNGVYLSLVSTPHGEFKGISNIGVKPTIDGDHRPGIETYIYDFTDDLYGESIKVKLLEFLRPEMKFASVEELKAQVDSNIETCLTRHNERCKTINLR